MKTEIISVFFYHKCFVNKCRKVSTSSFLGSYYKSKNGVKILVTG